MSHDAERRTTERKHYGKPVKFKTSALKKDSGPWVKDAMGVDISAHGLGMVTKYAMKTGDLVKLFVGLNGISENVPVFAEVKWSMTEGSLFRAGLRFLA